MTLNPTHGLAQMRDAENPPQIYVIATGGGSSIQSTLWRLPGASKYLVGSEFPYAEEATVAALGFRPEKFASIETAAALAQAAYQKLCEFKKPSPRVGVGISCSVASLKEHRGDHKACMVFITDTKCIQATVMLEKGVGQHFRHTDDILIEDCFLKCLFACTIGADDFYSPPNLVIEDAADLCHKVFMQHPYITATGERRKRLGLNVNVLVPTSCNPLHKGHVSLAQAACEAHAWPFYSFMVTVDPPHKPKLSVQDMIQRLITAKGHNVLFSEGDPLYIDKALRYPGVAFALGADAFDRMLDPKWGDVNSMLWEFKDLNVSFYVRGRMILNEETGEEEFLTMDDVLDKRLDQHMFAPVGIFTRLSGREDISSSQLRKSNT